MNKIENEYQQLLNDKLRLKKDLSNLPKGCISIKNINGIQYFYLQNKINGKVFSKYIKRNDIDELKKNISLQKKYKEELKDVESRLKKIESAGKLLGKELENRLLLLRICSGMDSLECDKKIECISFASAMNAIEGVPISEAVESDISLWYSSRKSFLSIFEDMIERYRLLGATTK